MFLHLFTPADDDLEVLVGPHPEEDAVDDQLGEGEEVAVRIAKAGRAATTASYTVDSAQVDARGAASGTPEQAVVAGDRNQQEPNGGVADASETPHEEAQAER
jgi:hypothetical protein